MPSTLKSFKFTTSPHSLSMISAISTKDDLTESSNKLDMRLETDNGDYENVGWNQNDLRYTSVESTAIVPPDLFRSPGIPTE